MYLFKYLNFYYYNAAKSHNDEKFSLPPEPLPPEVFKAEYNGTLRKTLPTKIHLTLRQALELFLVMNSAKKPKDPNYTVERLQQDGVCNGGAYIVRTEANDVSLKEFTSALLKLPADSRITLTLDEGLVYGIPQYRGACDKTGRTFPGPGIENVYYECNGAIEFKDSAGCFRCLELKLLETGHIYGPDASGRYARSPADAKPRPHNDIPRVDKQLLKAAFPMAVDPSPPVPDDKQPKQQPKWFN